MTLLHSRAGASRLCRGDVRPTFCGLSSSANPDAWVVNPAVADCPFALLTARWKSSADLCQKQGPSSRLIRRPYPASGPRRSARHQGDARRRTGLRSGDDGSRDRPTAIARLRCAVTPSSGSGSPASVMARRSSDSGAEWHPPASGPTASRARTMPCRLGCRPASTRSFFLGQRVVGLRRTLEIHSRDADQFITHAHEVFKRQGSRQVEPGPPTVCS